MNNERRNLLKILAALPFVGWFSWLFKASEPIKRTVWVREGLNHWVCKPFRSVRFGDLFVIEEGGRLLPDELVATSDFSPLTNNVETINQGKLSTAFMPQGFVQRIGPDAGFIRKELLRDGDFYYRIVDRDGNDYVFTPPSLETDPVSRAIDEIDEVTIELVKHKA